MPNANILLPESLGKRISKVIEVDLLERPTGSEMEWNESDNQLKLSFKRFEVKTLELQL